jgi:diguanylate cyclase (GGDEF)-like protein/PAS domain S-box-containing protein
MQLGLLTSADFLFDRQWLSIVGIGVFVAALTALLWYRGLYLSIRDENRNARELIENLSEGIYRSTLEGGILSANPALARLNGCDSIDELRALVNDIGAEWYVEPGRRDQFRRVLMREGQIKDFVSEVYRYGTRERIWVVESARLVRDPISGRPLYYEGSVREITETVKRLQLEQFYTKLINQVPGGLFQVMRDADGTGRINFVSPGFRKIMGLDGEDTPPPMEDFFAMIGPDHRNEFRAAIGRSAREQSRLEFECEAVDGKGVRKWIRIAATPEADDDSVIWHGYLTDCSLRKQHELAIERLAYNDPLTDLPNRRRLLERVEHAVRKCARTRRHGALLFLDLDNFKELNDGHGHHAGDTFLKLVAERLKSCAGENTVVARMGGDEFVVLIENAGKDQARAAQTAMRMASQLLAELRRPYDVQGISHVASASIGLVVFDGLADSADDILRKADIAMYRVKATGRDGLALFDGGTAEPLPQVPPRQKLARRQRRLSA